MQVLLSCTECNYQEVGHTEKELMNKIIIWNHVKKEHPQTAERVMRIYQHVPTSLFNIHTTENAPAAKFTPRYA
jgi:predicted small metal-binding protein